MDEMINDSMVDNSVAVDTQQVETPQEEVRETPVQEVEESVQAPQSNNFDSDRFTKAFSQRLNKEREKLQADYESRYNDRLNSELTPYKKLVEIAAKEFGVTPEEYLKNVSEKYGLTKDETSSPQKQLDPEIEEMLNFYRKDKETKETERIAREETEKLNYETSNLLKLNGEIRSLEDIPEAVLEMRANDNIPLHYAYAYWQMTEGRQALEKSIEEKTVSKLREVNRTSGSLTSQQATLGEKSISSMDTKSFNELIEKVKRGEIKSL